MKPKLAAVAGVDLRRVVQQPKETNERPFRIWDERALADLPHRCYMTEKAAIEKALGLLYWLELGNSYTIYDARSGRAVRQFVRRINGIIILE